MPINSFSFSAASFPRTSTSMGNRPPLSWSRCFAEESLAAREPRSSHVNRRTFFLRRENVQGFDREEHQRRRELVSEEPKLRDSISNLILIAAQRVRRQGDLLTCIALFLWNSGTSSTLPIMTTMEAAPPNRPSLDRRSFFHAVAKCEMRSWKSLLSILISAIVTAARATAGGEKSDKGDGWLRLSQRREKSVVA